MKPGVPRLRRASCSGAGRTRGSCGSRERADDEGERHAPQRDAGVQDARHRTGLLGELPRAPGHQQREHRADAADRRLQRGQPIRIPRQGGTLKTSDTIAVTSRGKRVLAVMSWQKYDVIRETMSILGDPALMRSLKRSLREARTGSLVSLAKVAKDLG